MSAGEFLTDFDLDLVLEGLAMRGDVAEMNSVIKCLGEQIQETKASICNEWQSFAEEAQLPLDSDFSSIRDIPKFFQEQIQMEKHTCTTKPINLNVFLNNVVQALERNVGHEEKILDELTNFAASQGFILPAPFPKTSDNLHASTVSLNVVVSENEETTSALWERIRNMVSRGLLMTVDKLELTQEKTKAETLFAEKVKLLEKMCTLYLPCDVWKKYMVLRSQQIERYLQNSAALDCFETEVECKTKEDIPEEAITLGRVSQALDNILHEDYSIVELGMFPEAFQMEPEEVFSVYLSGFKNKLGEVVRHLQTLGRRGSEKLDENSGNTMSLNIFLGLRQCVLAASSADISARKFFHSLQFYKDKRELLDSNFGSTFSLPSTPVEASDGNGADPLVSEVVRDEPEVTQRDMWCWQEEFKLVVTKLALVIAEEMQLVTRTALEREMEEYELSHKYEAVRVTDKMVNGSFDYPKQVAKSCTLIIAKTDELLPFLLLRHGKAFEPVRTSFVESLSTALTTYHSRLARISSDVPRSSPIRNLYLTFSSAVFIQRKLKQYEHEHGEITSSLSTVYCDLVETLYEKILSYHYTTIATVILQDVQSHHWMNQKEFFEGERCSFSVQMWNYYMEGLRHDLWEMCSPVRAQTIFTFILQYCLSYFIRRYSKAIPTYKRTKLFRSDITAILFSISSSMLFYVSSSSTDIFNPDPTKNALNEIHNSCSAMLAIMTVVSCPLETLCMFSSGGAEELISDGKSTGTSWLSSLQPELYGEHNKSILSLNDIQAVNIYFKLMVNQPQPVWELVLRTILLRDAYLAATIVTYLETYHIHLHQEDEPVALPKKNRVQFRTPCLVATGENQDDHCSGIVASLYYVILKCCRSSKPMVNFITSLINRENSWQIFTSAKGLKLGDEDKVPVWLDCIYSTFKPFISRLIDIMISGLCRRDKPTAKPFKFTTMTSLPCECHVTKQTQSRNTKDKTELILQAFERVLKTLVSSLRLLPRILFKVFNRIEGDLRQLKLVSDNTSSAGLKIIGSMLFRGLSSVGVDYVCHAEDLYCDEDIRKDCMQIAQIVYHVMAGEIDGFFDNAGLPIALETLMTSKKEWIVDQMRKLSDIISEMNEDYSFNEPGQDHFLELQYGLRVKELFLDGKGKKALEQAYNFFQSKKDWIVRRIPLVSYLGSPQQIPATGRNDAISSSFNPLRVYNSLGDYHFDHDAIENFPFDWEQMFQSNIGMTMKSIKRLVYNRYEMQTDGDVEEEKKELVAKLTAFYDGADEFV